MLASDAARAPADGDRRSPQEVRLAGANNLLNSKTGDVCHHVPAPREWWHREAQAGGSGWSGQVPMWWLAMRPCPHCGLAPLDVPDEAPPAPPPPRKQVPRPTPAATIDAIVWAYRARGAAALREPVNVERLRRCDARARAEIDRRIEKLAARAMDDA